MKTLHINVANKIATYRKRDGAIVCGNKDYELEFHFDEEWSAYNLKTARFVWNGQYYDCDFYGDKCSIPMIQGATEVHVGVYAGDLCTTTSAVIPSVPSILCESSVPQPESGQNYSDEAREAAREAKEAASRAEGLLIEHDAEEQQYRKQTAQTISFIEQDIQDILEGGGGGGSGARGMKTFTVENFSTLHACISEHTDVEMNGEAVTPAVFRHGDVLRVREAGVPDFFFESADSIYDESELDQHDHTYTYEGKVYDMTVYGLYGMEVLGYLHPVKGVGGADEETAEPGSRTYVVDTFEKFLAQIELGGSLAYQSFDNTTLNTGDQVIIKSGDVPCFWFEKGGTADEYEQDGTSHNLAVYDAEGGIYLGTFHPIQSADAETTEPGSRTYVVDTFDCFMSTLLSGNICSDCKLDTEALQTGDQVIIKTGDHPSFWFEKDGEPVDYTYNGEVYSLGAWEGIGYNRLGTFHPSNESRIIGGIETALDSIIAIQERLIGGDGV